MTPFPETVSNPIFCRTLVVAIVVLNAHCTKLREICSIENLSSGRPRGHGRQSCARSGSSTAFEAREAKIKVSRTSCHGRHGRQSRTCCLC